MQIRFRPASRIAIGAASSAVGLSLFTVAPSIAIAQSVFNGSSCSLSYDAFVQFTPSSPFTIREGQVTFSGGSMILTMQPPDDGAGAGKTALVTTVQSLLYGTVEAQITQSYVPGAVTGLTLAKATFDQSDEIDFEWLGSERNSVWTKFFYRGLRDPQGAPYYDSRSMNLSVAADNSRNFHTYKIEWTPYAITWSIDGTVRRVQNRTATWEAKGTGDMLDPPADHYHYPDQPLLIRLGIYDPTGAPWSGGPINWTDPLAVKGANAQIASLKITCYQGPYPSNMSAPPSDPKSSDTYGIAPDPRSFFTTTTSSRSASATTAPASYSPTTNGTVPASSSSSATPIIAGSIAGAVVLLGAVICAVFFLVIRPRRENSRNVAQKKRDPAAFSPHPGAPPTAGLPAPYYAPHPHNHPNPDVSIQQMQPLLPHGPHDRHSSRPTSAPSDAAFSSLHSPTSSAAAAISPHMHHHQPAPNAAMPFLAASTPITPDAWRASELHHRVGYAPTTSSHPAYAKSETGSQSTTTAHHPLPRDSVLSIDPSTASEYTPAQIFHNYYHNPAPAPTAPSAVSAAASVASTTFQPLPRDPGSYDKKSAARGVSARTSAATAALDAPADADRKDSTLFTAVAAAAGNPGDVATWSVAGVGAFLGRCGFGADVVSLFYRNDIDGRLLLALDAAFLRNELGIDSAGLRARILMAVEPLRPAAPAPAADPPATAADAPGLPPYSG